MVIDMNEQQLNTVVQLRAFLNGTPEVQFEPIGEDTQRYAFVAAVVARLCTLINCRATRRTKPARRRIRSRTV